MNAWHTPLIALFAIVAVGLALGRVRLAGFSLDISAVVFVALGFGALGVTVDPIFQTLGLVLFVYSVGIQAGPGFLPTLRSQGLKLWGPVLLLIILSVSTDILLARFFQLDPRLALGLLTGARSSNSALAVGVTSTGSSLPALGHSLAYPLGVLGALLFVRLLPRLFGAKIDAEERLWLAKQTSSFPPLETRTFEVVNPVVVGKPWSTIVPVTSGVNLSRVLHQGAISIPTPQTVLDEGDMLKIVGTSEALERLESLLGKPVPAPAFPEVSEDRDHDARWITVTSRHAVNRTLAELSLGPNFRVTATRIRRREVELAPEANSTVRFGDLVMIVGRRGALGEVERFLGGLPRPIESDFFPLAMTLVVGLLLGSVQIPLGPDFVLSLGLTGGVLVSALALGSLGRTGPVVWTIQAPSQKFVRQLGLVMFLAAVGSDAGSRLGTVWAQHGLAITITALTISLVPLGLTALVCRFILRQDIATLMGLLSGATTCSPALAVVSSKTTTNAATLAYSAAYPFAMLVMMLTAQLLAWFMV